VTTLSISGLRAAVDGTEILHGVDLEVGSGRVEVIMGPNGSGKSTLAHVIMGHPRYEVVAGSVTLDGRDLLALPTHERAALGVFHLMQYPTEVPGVPVASILAEALAARGDAPNGALAARVTDEAALVHLDQALLARGANVDYSGGEKKRAETVQLAVLGPKIAVLDEVDSGLDVDALRDVSRRIEALTTEAGLGVLAITHYARLLDELKADAIHVLLDGRIVQSGGPELARELERTGYEGLAAELGIELVRREEAARAGKEAGRGVAMEVEGPMTEGL
jgi:Fe-S cluster assembly ATP-binding protein